MTTDARRIYPVSEVTRENGRPVLLPQFSPKYIKVPFLSHTVLVPKRNDRIQVDYSFDLVRRYPADPPLEWKVDSIEVTRGSYQPWVKEVKWRGRTAHPGAFYLILPLSVTTPAKKGGVPGTSSATFSEKNPLAKEIERQTTSAEQEDRELVADPPTPDPSTESIAEETRLAEDEEKSD